MMINNLAILLILVPTLALGQAGTFNDNKERGRDSVNSTRDLNEDRSARSTSKNISVNALILQAYIDMYENGEISHCDASSGVHKLANLSTATKVVSNPSYYFPVWINECFGDGLTNCDMRRGNIYPANEAVNRLKAYFKRIGRMSNPVVSDPQGSSLVSMDDETTAIYVDQIVAAHLITKDVAYELTGKVYRSVDEVNSEIRAKMCLPKGIGKFYNELTSIESAMVCMGQRYSFYTLSTQGGWNWVWSQPFKFNCGSVAVDAENHKFSVYGRETLSPNSIGGINVTVSIESDRSSSKVNEASKSRFDKSTRTNSKQKVEGK